LRLRSFSGGRPQLCPRHQRLLNTASGGSAGKPARSSVFALAMGCALFGLGGYYVGTRSNIHLAPSHASHKPVYGTPEDFARAIGELKTSFAENAVTTAKDQLEAHGFSSNTHLPGTSRHWGMVIYSGLELEHGFTFRVST
jgi:hypothetical protein